MTDKPQQGVNDGIDFSPELRRLLSGFPIPTPVIPQGGRTARTRYGLLTVKPIVWPKFRLGS